MREPSLNSLCASASWSFIVARGAMINRICLGPTRALYVTRLRGGHLPFVEALSSPLTGRHTLTLEGAHVRLCAPHSYSHFVPSFFHRAQQQRALATAARISSPALARTSTAIHTHMPSSSLSLLLLLSAASSTPHPPGSNNRLDDRRQPSEQQSAVPSREQCGCPTLKRNNCVDHTWSDMRSTSRGPRVTRAAPTECHVVLQYTMMPTRRLILPSPRSSLHRCACHPLPRSPHRRGKR